MTSDDFETLQRIQRQADARGIGLAEYSNAILAALDKAEKKYPNNKLKTFEFARYILSKKYPQK